MSYAAAGRPVRKNPPASPLRVPPNLPFTDADYQQQRKVLLYGGEWDDQYDIPTRPWSSAHERYCEEARLAAEAEDWEVARRRVAGRF
jgi:hypothetical protein